MRVTATHFISQVLAYPSQLHVVLTILQKIYFRGSYCVHNPYGARQARQMYTYHIRFTRFLV